MAKFTVIEKLGTHIHRVQPRKVFWKNGKRLMFRSGVLAILKKLDCRSHARKTYEIVGYLPI